jgi:hypothetical protein
MINLEQYKEMRAQWMRVYSNVDKNNLSMKRIVFRMNKLFGELDQLVREEHGNRTNAIGRDKSPRDKAR